MTRSEIQLMPNYYYLLVLTLAAIGIAVSALAKDFPLSVKKTSAIDAFAALALIVLPSFGLWLAKLWNGSGSTDKSLFSSPDLSRALPGVETIYVGTPHDVRDATLEGDGITQTANGDAARRLSFRGGSESPSAK